MSRTLYGKTDTETYSQDHIKRVVRALDLSIENETVHDFLIFCPFHGNSDTPSLSLSKSNGRYLCFNPACSERGSIIDLVKSIKNFNDFEALRYIINIKPTEQDNFESSLASLLEVEDDFQVFDPLVLDHLSRQLPGSEGEKYMASRGFSKETLKDFGVGFSRKTGMVTVPVYSHTSIPVGLIGRSVEGKRFKNSIGLPSAKVFFNMNRAMRKSSTAIVVEASFDAMRVAQAGFPNVIATIGGHISPYKHELLNKYFTKIIIMTDNDKPQFRSICRPCGGVCRGHNPGRELGFSLANNFRRDVSWAVWSDSEVYPNNAKDAGDCSDDQIRKLIENAVTDVEYRMVNML